MMAAAGECDGAGIGGGCGDSHDDDIQKNIECTCYIYLCHFN